MSAHFDLLGDAEDAFFEFQREVFAQVGAALRARATTSLTASAAEHVAEAEQVAKDVLEVDGAFEATKALTGCVADPAWPKRS